MGKEGVGVKQFVWGLVCGVALASSSVAFASSSIQALFFPAHFEINGSTVSLPPEYKVLQVEGRTYVPVRFVAENLGATVDYDPSTQRLVIKNQKLDITDPNYATVAVGNLIVTKEGNQSKVTGQLQIEGVGNSQNSIEGILSFYNANQEKLGEVMIRGNDFGVVAKAFTVYGSGDYREYKTAKLQVQKVNDEKIAVEPEIAYENKDFHFSLSLPKSWEGKVKVVKSQNEGPEATFDFVNQANQAYGGVIFSLSVWKKEDWEQNGASALEIGRTVKLGEQGNLVYTISRPGDVQYDLVNEALQAEYLQMASYTTSISTSFQTTK